MEIAIPFGTRHAGSYPLAHVQAPKTADAHAYIALWMEIFGKTVHDMTQREWKLARQEDWPDTIFDQNIRTLTYDLRENTISLPPPGWCKAHGGTDPVFTARCGWQRHGGSYHMWRAARYVEFAQDLLRTESARTATCCGCVIGNTCGLARATPLSRPDLFQKSIDEIQGLRPDSWEKLPPARGDTSTA